MEKASTNLITVLGLITVAFAGYYLYTQHSATLLDGSANTTEAELAEMLAETSRFIEYANTLEVIKLDDRVLTDRQFTGLRSFRTEVEPRPVGRDNPFLEARTVNSTQ